MKSYCAALPTLVLSLVFALLLPATGFAEFVLPAPHSTETVVSFDPIARENPESIIVDRNGDFIVSIALTGEIRRITRDGQHSTVAVIPITDNPGVPCQADSLPGVLGAIVQDHRGVIYANAAACELENRGVWEVLPDGKRRRISPLPAGSLPNGITLARGSIFVADSALGVVWKVSKEGGPAEVWSDHPLLADDPTVFGPGPNGIQRFRGELYVANSGTAQIVAIPFEGFDDAGEPRVHATMPFGCDDFAFDVLGNLYCTTDPSNRIVRVTPDGKSDVILTADDGLDGPTAAAFGRFGQDRFNLYITNAAFPFFTIANTPSIIKTNVGIPGAPN